MLLETINSPADVKNLPVSDLPALCAEIRNYMIACCSKNPGHLGASLGAVELCVALHYVYDSPTDKFLWDVGHQAYAHKIITGRRDQFQDNRKKGGISGFPKREESIHDAFGAGHSSTSISAALGMAVAAEKQGRKEHVVAVIGDGAMGGGMAFEGLNHAGSLKTDLLVILNDNQISIDKNTGALHNYLVKISLSRTYNRLKEGVWRRMGSGIRNHVKRIFRSTKMAVIQGGTLFESLGFRYFGAIDGNDVLQLVNALERLKTLDGPKLLHIITQKGKGYEPAEKNQVVWHAPGAFDPETGERLAKKGDADRYQDVFGETLLELARTDKRIVGITPAMLSGSSLNIMQREMPDRVFDVGIAEQHAVTFSAGLAANGLLPFCNIYSSFMQRAYDSVIHDVALQKIKVIFCLDRAGLVGEDGATHQGAYDLAAFRPIPNLTILAPMDETELKQMMYAICGPEYGPTILRYPRGTGRGTDWRTAPIAPITLGKSRCLEPGNHTDTVILSLGTAGNWVTDALKTLRENHKENLPAHYDMRFLKPIDTDLVEEVAQKYSHIITVEDGCDQGGLHGAVCEYLAGTDFNGKITALGIPDRFIEQGTVNQQREECNLNKESILRTIQAAVVEKKVKEN